MTRGCALVLTILAPLLAGACDRRDGPLPTADTSSLLRAALTPEAAARLLPRDVFPNSVASGRGVISPDTARALAVGYLRLFGAQTMERTRAILGRDIDFVTLAAEERVLLSETPYAPLPADVSPALRNAAGASYLVRLRDKYGQVAVVSVSVHASAIRTDSSGISSKESERGSEFRSWIVPWGGVAEPAISAEAAVVLAYAAFGVRIAHAPRFIRKGIEFVPQLGNWRVQFAEPVQVRRSGTSTAERTDVVYITPQGEFAAPTLSESTGTTKTARLQSEIYGIVLQPRQDIAKDLDIVVPLPSRHRNAR